MAVLIQLLACVTTLGILLIPMPASPAAAADEYELKAAFLYKFSGFVQWPEENSGTVPCIGVLGQDPFGPSLDQAVQGKLLGSREFSVIRSRKRDDVAACRIVFISASEQRELSAILHRLSGSVLTVGDMPGFCERGGMIGFELVDRRVRLRINLEAALRARLQISSKLLSVAKLVEGAPQ